MEAKEMKELEPEPEPGFAWLGLKAARAAAASNNTP